MEAERCEDSSSILSYEKDTSSMLSFEKDLGFEKDTSGLLSYGLDGKSLRMVSNSPSIAGPRHTIDNILGLARKQEQGDMMERAHTPGNAESAGKLFINM